jgi:hypothetical protein
VKCLDFGECGLEISVFVGFLCWLHFVKTMLQQDVDPDVPTCEYNTCRALFSRLWVFYFHAMSFENLIEELFCPSVYTKTNVI